MATVRNIAISGCCSSNVLISSIIVRATALVIYRALQPASRTRLVTGRWSLFSKALGGRPGATLVCFLVLRVRVPARVLGLHLVQTAFNPAARKRERTSLMVSREGGCASRI